MTQVQTTNPGFFQFTARMRLVFPVLIEPKKIKINGKETGEPKYQATFLLAPDHPNLLDFKKLAGKTARDKWPGIEFAKVHFPFSAGDEYAAKREAAGRKADEFKGMVQLKARTTFPVTLDLKVNGKAVSLSREDNLDLIKKHFYSGVEVLAEVTLKASETNGNKYVTAYLNSVYSYGAGHGEKIGGGRSAEERWSGHIGEETDEDPTQGMDDEIPF